jgi:hypothetical protein
MYNYCMNLFKIIQSVLSAFIGIQKNSKFNEDDNLIEKYGFMPYFLVGLCLAVIFIFTLIFIVSQIIG